MGKESIQRKGEERGGNLFKWFDNYVRGEEERIGGNSWFEKYVPRIYEFLGNLINWIGLCSRVPRYCNLERFQ